MHFDSTSGFQLASHASAAVLVAQPDSAGHLALWGVLITSAASIITAALKRRSDSQRDERHRQWEREERIARRQELQLILEAADSRAAHTAKLPE